MQTIKTMWKAIFQNKPTIYKANLPSFVQKIIKSRCYVDLSRRLRLKSHPKMATWERLIGMRVLFLSPVTICLICLYLSLISLYHVQSDKFIILYYIIIILRFYHDVYRLLMLRLVAWVLPMFQVLFHYGHLLEISNYKIFPKLFHWHWASPLSR
jgi:hypothetical protein